MSRLLVRLKRSPAQPYSDEGPAREQRGAEVGGRARAPPRHVGKSAGVGFCGLHARGARAALCAAGRARALTDGVGRAGRAAAPRRVRVAAARAVGAAAAIVHCGGAGAHGERRACWSRLPGRARGGARGAPRQPVTARRAAGARGEGRVLPRAPHVRVRTSPRAARTRLPRRRRALPAPAAAPPPPGSSNRAPYRPLPVPGPRAGPAGGAGGRGEIKVSGGLDPLEQPRAGLAAWR